VGRAVTSDGQVFVSYVREDASAAGRLHLRLAEAGISSWRDTEDLIPGQYWAREIRRAISEVSIVFLACFSLLEDRG
jgi:hypothetical protein